jgi:hypothetical protein
MATCFVNASNNLWIEERDYRPLYKGPQNFTLFENLDKREWAMFRFGSKTAKSKMSRKLVKKPTAQTSSKLRPIGLIGHEFFVLNVDMMGTKKSSFDADSKKVNLP